MHSTSLIPVEGHNNFARDPKTGAIINVNETEFEKYIATRNKLQTDRDKLNSTREEVQKLKEDVSEIKNLLLKLVSDTNY
jgi:uncharacterized coiled-coil DUF342 family protein